MDMQNVSNLEIPEGEVRTIHDKDSRLLWGRVHYDTKYKGDTFQQTYSGKNLIPYPYASSSSSPRVSAGITFIDNGDGTITINGQNDGTGNSVYYLVGGGNTLTLPAGTYYVNTSAMFSTGGTITMYDGSSYRGFSLSNPSVTLTQQTTFSSVYYQITRNNTLSLNNVKLYPIMSSTSGQTVDNWEPYVGSTPTQITPAPNPDYPQDVQTVTGEQTITVSDGNNSEDFTVDLGSIQLAKIGTYQDYIYKSGDDWYVHKAIKKTIFTGATEENWTSSWSGHRMDIAEPDAMLGSASNNPIMANRYISRFSTIDNSIFLSGSSHSIGVMDYTNTSSISNWKTWLASNSLIVYCALATPTDTKITDATLIGQLNAIHEWLTRYGYNATVTGNLPMIIDRTNL